MKRIIILEGIASSGKSTLEKLLAGRLDNPLIISENETLMPIIDNRDVVVACTFLEKHIQTIEKNSARYIIIDRFHLTHAFRTQSLMEPFADLETALLKTGRVLLVLLIINPDHIKDRIEETTIIRKENWKKGAQGSMDEKVAYYTRQQQTLISLLASSQLPTLTINTTKKNWNDFTNVITQRLMAL